ncbi:MAG: HAD-IC family P-type ATPase, partial [Candidatus Diapherotrites archaeon]|nr:HAD-IC family P-type ATPase [Candidatus Diapherotrites archaeon]
MTLTLPRTPQYIHQTRDINKTNACCQLLYMGLIRRGNMSEYYQLPPEEVLRALKTRTEGLTNEEAASRLNEYGPNTIQLEKKINVWGLLIGQFTELLVVVLIGAGILSYLVGGPLDTLVIFAIVIINGLLGFFQEYKAEKAIDELKKMGAQRATVKRNGKLLQIDAKDLVPGDIVQLEEGDKIPADIRFIETIETAVDEAILTGESSAVNKKIDLLNGTLAVADRINYGYANTSIVRGRGLGVVIYTGLKTEFGKIAEKLEEVEDEPTPLKQNLEVLAKQLTLGVVCVMIILFVIGYFIQGRELIEMLLLAIALGVAAIPEGLPAVTTITLALGVQQMARKNALIKHLPSVETLGSTTVICSDKTGTLTKNEMTVEYVYADEQLYRVTGVGYSSAGEIQWNNQQVNVETGSALELTIQNGVHNNNAQFHANENTILGDPTEGCMLVLGTKTHILSTFPRVNEIPFTSERKKMTTIHTLNTNTQRAFMKGAVEKVLEKSILVLEHGKRVPLTEGKKQQLLVQAETLSKNAYRVLG